MSTLVLPLEIKLSIPRGMPWPQCFSSNSPSSDNSFWSLRWRQQWRCSIQTPHGRWPPLQRLTSQQVTWWFVPRTAQSSSIFLRVGGGEIDNALFCWELLVWLECTCATPLLHIVRFLLCAAQTCCAALFLMTSSNQHDWVGMSLF